MTEIRLPLDEGDAARARAMRSKEYLARRDYLRELRRLSASWTQVELMDVLGLDFWTLRAQLAAAAVVEDALDGFSGNSPHEIVRRYAAGEIDRARMLDELTRFTYDSPPIDEYDGFSVDDPSAHYFDEVVRAFHRHLIDEATYTTVASCGSRDRRPARRDRQSDAGTALLTRNRSTIVQGDVGRARILRSREHVARRDYLRELRRLSASMTYTELDDEAGVSLFKARELLIAASQVDDVPDGFSGSNPHEIAHRHVAGEIDRGRMLDELTRWPSDAPPSYEDHDVYYVQHPYERYRRDLDDAVRVRLLDADTYDWLLTVTKAT